MRSCSKAVSWRRHYACSNPNEAGRAALLPLGALSKPAPVQVPADDACLGLASNLVQAPAGLKAAVELLLGQVLVVRDRDAARRLIAGQTGHVRAVTLRGEVFRADGLVVAGKSSQGSTLSRPRQRRELGESLAILNERLESFEAVLQTLNSDLQAAQEALSVAEASLREMRAKLTRAQAKERETAVELDSARRQLEWGNKQLEAVQAELSRAEAEWTALMQAQHQIKSESARDQEEVQCSQKAIVRPVVGRSPGAALLLDHARGGGRPVAEQCENPPG